MHALARIPHQLHDIRVLSHAWTCKRSLFVLPLRVGVHSRVFLSFSVVAALLCTGGKVTNLGSDCPILARSMIQHILDLLHEFLTLDSSTMEQL